MSDGWLGFLLDDDREYSSDVHFSAAGLGSTRDVCPFIDTIDIPLVTCHELSGFNLQRLHYNRVGKKLLLSNRKCNGCYCSVTRRPRVIARAMSAVDVSVDNGKCLNNKV